MQKIFLAIFVLGLSFAIHAKVVSIELEKAPVNLQDVASIKRGAKFFANNCMSCHTLIYLRYDQLAKDAGVSYEKMPINVKQWPFGVKPPDLSLEANYRGVDWIYTYLHSFYQDTSRPTGFNNLLVPNTAMPGIITPYQGQQILAADLAKSKKIFDSAYEWYDLVTLKQHGTQSQAQFDDTVRDVVNFLDYAANPYQSLQRKIGFWVIGFFIIMFILMYWLKHEYWKAIDKNKKD